MSSNLYSLFRQNFPEDLRKPFIVSPQGDEISYGDVEKESAQFANLLCALGVAPGDRVSVQVEKSARALIFYLGCLRAGVTYLPLNTAYTPEELDYFLNDARPNVFVCDPSQQDRLQKQITDNAVSHSLTLDCNGEGSLRDQAIPQSTNHKTIKSEPDDPAAILYSSGTTGKPKGAVLSHAALAANATALHNAWQFNENDILLHALPIFHTHGLFVATNTVLMNGTCMILHAGFNPDEVIAGLCKATLFMGVPTYYTRLLKSDSLTPDACRSIRLFISGSAPLLDETFRAFTDRTGHSIIERYGMTEAGIITSADPDKSRQAGMVGWPLNGVTVRISDESDTPVPQGQTGNVQIKGSSLFSGYWGNPDKTAEEFTNDGFFRTGDIGQLETGGQLTLVGRAKDMFISGGFNVFPKEIEQAVDAMEGVEECAVVGLPHPDFGEAGLALVVANKDVVLDSHHIRAVLKDSLANYKVPKLVLTIPELPRNAMGKVQKNTLRETYRRQWDEIILK